MYDIEKQSLEAHVELCAERYLGLSRRLDQMDRRMDELTEMLTAINEKIETIIDRNNSKWDTTQLAVIGLLATITGALIVKYIL